MNDQIQDILIQIAKEVIKERVYGIPASKYYERTYQLLDAVDFKITQVGEDSLSFTLKMNPDLINTKDRPDQLDAYQSESGVDKRDDIFDKINEGRHRHHKRGQVRPRFIEKTREQLSDTNIIEQILAEALIEEGWDVTITNN